MNTLPESTINLILSGLMGALGSLLCIPIYLWISSQLKREEQLYQHKLDVIAKQRELLLEHKVELERKGKNAEIAQIKEAVSRLEQAMEQVISHG